MTRVKLHVNAACIPLLVLSVIIQHTNLSARELTINDAVTRALDYYPLIQQRKAELQTAHAHVSTVEGNRLPMLKIHDQVSLGTANGVNGSFFPMGVIVPTAGGVRPENNYKLASGNFGVSYLEWEVFNFGYYSADKKNAKAGEAFRSAMLNYEEFQIAQTVIADYFDMLRQYQSLQLETQNVKRTETIYTAIRATVLGGLKPGVDSMTASAELARAKVKYYEALTKYNDSRITLASLTGMQAEEIIPDTSIFSKVINKTGLGLLMGNDTINDTQPVLDVYHQQYLQQLADNKATGRKYLPKFYIVGMGGMRGSSISYADVYSNNLSDGLKYSRYNYVFGAAMTYNLFDLKHRHDQLREGRYTADAKLQAFNTTKSELLKAMQQTKDAYTNTLLQLQEIPGQINASRQAYQQQLALYRSGLNTLVDVTNALYALSEAETSYIIAQDTLLKLLSTGAGLNNQLSTFLEQLK